MAITPFSYRLPFPDHKKFSAPFGKLHHKLMVIDDTIVVAGSINFTKTANIYNDENFLIIGSPYPHLPEEKGGPSDIKECKKTGTFFKNEITRLRELINPPQSNRSIPPSPKN